LQINNIFSLYRNLFQAAWKYDSLSALQSFFLARTSSLLEFCDIRLMISRHQLARFDNDVFPEWAYWCWSNTVLHNTSRRRQYLFGEWM